MSHDDIITFIIDRFLFGNGERLSDETPLLESHIIDSTGVLEIVTFLEKAFGIRIEDDELVPENLNSIKNILQFIERKKSGPA